MAIGLSKVTRLSLSSTQSHPSSPPLTLVWAQWPEGQLLPGCSGGGSAEAWGRVSVPRQTSLSLKAIFRHTSYARWQVHG